MIGRTNTFGDNKVVVYAIASSSDLPATAVANTIYVITSTAINNIILTVGNVPETASEGDVAITIDNDSEYELGLTHFKLQYGMVSVRQYVDGSWVGKEAYREKDGSWVMIYYSLVKDGVETSEHLLNATAFTGVASDMMYPGTTTANPVITYNTGYIQITVQKGRTTGYAWIRFDVTPFNKISIRYTTSFDTKCGLHNDLSTSYTSGFTSWLRGCYLPTTSVSDIQEFDISDLTGSQYLFFSSYYYYGYGANVCIYDIWMA